MVRAHTVLDQFEHNQLVIYLGFHVEEKSVCLHAGELV